MIYIYVLRFWTFLASGAILLLFSCNGNNEERKLSEFEADLGASSVVGLQIFKGGNDESLRISSPKSLLGFWETQIRRMKLIKPDSEFAKANARELVGTVTVRLKSGK